MLFGNGSSRRVAATIVSPAAETEFVVAAGQTISGISSGLEGLTIEGSFRSDFAVICGTTASPIGGGGAWSFTATAIAGDVGETELKIRCVEDQQELDTLACTVASE